MSNDETLDFIKNLEEKYISLGDQYAFAKCVELRTAYEATIPERPEFIGKTYRCPKCARVLRYRHTKDRFCPCCGQMLDWDGFRERNMVVRGVEPPNDLY